MSRFPVAAAFFLFAAVAAPSTPAQASTVISGQIGGEEVLPEAADVAREAASMEPELRRAFALARQLGDRAGMATVQALWQRVQSTDQRVRTLLRQANTTVYLYGAAAGRLDRTKIVEFLRIDARWRHANVHIYYRNGIQQWSLKAPIGYDGSGVPEADPAPPPSRPQGGRIGETIRVGNTGVVPFAFGGSTPPAQPKPTPPAPPRRPAGGGTESHTIWGL